MKRRVEEEAGTNKKTKSARKGSKKEEIVDEKELQDALKIACMRISESVSTEMEGKMTFDGEVIAHTARMVWDAIQDWSSDLQMFAQHANRNGVSAEDARLLLRKNEHLKKAVLEKCKMEEPVKRASTGRRGRPPKARSTNTDTPTVSAPRAHSTPFPTVTPSPHPHPSTPSAPPSPFSLSHIPSPIPEVTHDNMITPIQEGKAHLEYPSMPITTKQRVITPDLFDDSPEQNKQGYDSLDEELHLANEEEDSFDDADLMFIAPPIQPKQEQEEPTEQKTNIEKKEEPSAIKGFSFDDSFEDDDFFENVQQNPSTSHSTVSKEQQATVIQKDTTIMQKDTPVLKEFSFDDPPSPAKVDSDIFIPNTPKIPKVTPKRKKPTGTRTPTSKMMASISDDFDASIFDDE